MSENINEKEVQTIELPVISGEAEAVNYDQTKVIYVKAEEKKGNGLGVTSMVLGILALVFMCCSCCNLLFIIPSVICGIVALCKKEPKKGFAISGIVLSVVAFLAMIIFSVVFGSFNYSYDYNVGDEQYSYEEEYDFNDFMELFNQLMEEAAEAEQA